MKNVILICMMLFSAIVFAEESPSIRIRPASITFPEAGQRQLLQQILLIKNAGNGMLNITLRSSCECLKVAPAIAAISPGIVQEIAVELDTRDYVGKITEFVFADSNDPINPHITIAVEGKVNGNSKPFDTPEIVHTGKGPPVCITIFSTPNCKYCQRLETSIIPQIGKKYKANVKIRQYFVNKPEVYEQLLLLEEAVGMQSNEFPVVFVGKHMLGGRKQISSQLEDKIKQCVSHGGCNWISVKAVSGVVLLQERLASIKLLPIIVAGLLDGVNPCAFASVVFFLSYLILIGYNRKKILIAGIIFITTVFFTYLLIGLGIIHVFWTLNFKPIRYLIAFLTMALGVISLIDCWNIKHGKENMLIQLPSIYKAKIQKCIDYGIQKGYILSALILGFLISIFEFACTGQIYVPTLMYMAQIHQLRITAFNYLVLYNLMFIFPLFVVFWLGYNGIRSKVFLQLLQKHLAIIKFIVAIFFFGMGVLLLRPLIIYGNQ
ncbi:MAG: hypothetical protein V1749_00680 [Candidatus Desantisbacteria bacterium]